MNEEEIMMGLLAGYFDFTGIPPIKACEILRNRVNIIGKDERDQVNYFAPPSDITIRYKNHTLSIKCRHAVTLSSLHSDMSRIAFNDTDGKLYYDGLWEYNPK